MSEKEEDRLIVERSTAERENSEKPFGMDSNEYLTASDEELQEDNHGTQTIQQQLQILQSLTPNSNQTDGRSILQEVSDYLQGIHRETEKIEKELSERSEGNGSSSGTGIHNSITVPHILRVEIEKMVGGRFVVKMNWKKGPGVAAQVQRLIESLELELKMTSINLVDQQNPHEMLTTAFVQVMNEVPITEEELHNMIMGTAARLGFVQ